MKLYQDCYLSSIKCYDLKSSYVYYKPGSTFTLVMFICNLLKYCRIYRI